MGRGAAEGAMQRHGIRPRDISAAGRRLSIFVYTTRARAVSARRSGRLRENGMLPETKEPQRSDACCTPRPSASCARISPPVSPR